VTVQGLPGEAFGWEESLPSIGLFKSAYIDIGTSTYYVYGEVNWVIKN